MMTIRIMAIISLVLTMTFGAALQAAEVRSISREVKSDFDGETVWTVYVKCAGVTDERAVERYNNDRKWCAEDLPTLCGRNKVKVANKVCGTHFERLASEYRVEKAKEEEIAGDN